MGSISKALYPSGRPPTRSMAHEASPMPRLNASHAGIPVSQPGNPRRGRLPRQRCLLLVPALRGRATFFCPRRVLPSRQVSGSQRSSSRATSPRCAQSLRFRLAAPYSSHPADNAYRCWHGAFGAHGTLRLAGNVQVLGVGQPMGDMGRLERHYGSLLLQGLLNVSLVLCAQAAGSMQRSSLLRGLLTKRLTG